MKNIKIKVTPSEFREIQRIAFDKGIYWDYSSESKTKTSDMLYIDGKLSWETPELAYSKNYEEMKSEDFIRQNTTFPIYKTHKDGLYIVEFSDINCGVIVWVRDDTTGHQRLFSVQNNHLFEVGDYRSDWMSYYENLWSNTSNDTLNVIKDFNKNSDEEQMNPAEPQKGAIVLATRKSTDAKHGDYTWQGTYYGKFNEHHLLDFNGTSYRIADEVKIIPTLTKKEAKQKISELFNQPKNVTSEKIRNIIDLIKI